MIAEMTAQEIGVLAACLLYIIKMMWEGVMKLKTPKDNNQLIKTDFYEMKQQVKDLHIWHDKEDENGSKVWYVKTSIVAKAGRVKLPELSIINNESLINLPVTPS